MRRFETVPCRRAMGISDSMTLVQTNDVLDYFEQETTRKLSDFIQTAKKEDRLMLFWSKLSEHYNTISTMLLSVLLLIPSWGGSIGNLKSFLRCCQR